MVLSGFDGAWILLPERKTVGVGLPGTSGTSPRVRPNPASSRIMIAEPAGRAIRRAELYNMLGVCLARKEIIPSESLILDASDIPTGAYRVVLGYRDGGTTSLPVIVGR